MHGVGPAKTWTPFSDITSELRIMFNLTSIHSTQNCKMRDLQISSCSNVRNHWIAQYCHIGWKYFLTEVKTHQNNNIKPDLSVWHLPHVLLYEALN